MTQRPGTRLIRAHYEVGKRAVKCMKNTTLRSSPFLTFLCRCAADPISLGEYLTRSNARIIKEGCGNPAVHLRAISPKIGLVIRKTNSAAP